MTSKPIDFRRAATGTDISDGMQAELWHGGASSARILAATVDPQQAQAPVESSLNGIDEAVSGRTFDIVGSAAPMALAFAAGNIVVYRVGTGSAALTSAAQAVFLDEYTTTGAFVQSIAMPTSVSGSNHTFTASGTSTAEGLLNRSVDGRYLLLTGYDAAPGTASVNGTTGATVPRVVARVGADGTIDTSTALADFSSGSSPRSAISTNGTDLWITGGAGGIRYTTIGATSSTQLAVTPTTFRSLEIFEDQLYVSASTGATRIATVGTGTPTTSGQTVTNIPGAPTSLGSPYGMFFADLDGNAGVDTLYVCDDGIGLLKYTLVSGSWTASGTIGTTSDDYFGLTGSVSGTTVTLYATRLNGGGADTIVSVVDTSGFGGTLAATPTTLVTAAANTAFRGVDFAPSAAPPAATITIQATSVSHAEGDSGGTDFVFTLTRSAGTADATVDYAVTGTGGLDGSDFVGATLPTGTATFTGTDLTTTVTIHVAGDFDAEADETFTVTLSNPSAGNVLGSQSTQTGTIVDDDSHGTISVADVQLVEGDSATTAGAFTLSRTGGSIGTVSVDYVITLPGVPGGADSSDVSATLTGTVTFLDGETSATIPFTVNGDYAVEPDETFAVEISNPQGGALLGTATAVATIINDDVPGSVSVSDISIVEGDSGQSFGTVTLTRTGGSGDFTVDYAMIDGSATFADGDYEAASGTVTFTGGATTATIQVAINGDTVAEGDESFSVALFNPSDGAIISGNAATITITDDEGAGTVSISDAQVVEGDGGTVSLVFTLTRSAGSTAFDVSVATSDDTATAGVDYDSNSQVISFAANETTQTFTVTVNGDTDIEPDETLFATLSGATNGATLGDDTATGTITTDDFAAGSVSIADMSVVEGDSGDVSLVLTVTRSGGSAAFSVDYATADGTAADGSDYAGQSGTLNFAFGQNTATISIAVHGDLNVESDETFGVTLSNPTAGATIGDGDAVATITNDDTVPVASIADTSIVEGNSGVTYLVFTVSLSKPPADPVTLDFATSNGTATAGSDYLAYSGQVSFAAGETSQTIRVPVIGDTRPEGSETLSVTLSNPTGATLGDGAAIGTITDNDGPAYYALSGGSFSQDWSNTAQITANDNWSGVPFILGHLGQDITTGTGTNPATLLTDSNVANDIDVIANQTNPNSLASGGVAEFDGIANPTIALQGSGTGDAPYIRIFLDSSGRDHVTVSYDLRDIDGSTDNSVQPVALQYRVGNSGTWTNVAAAFVSDATSGPSLATLVTHVSAELPADAANQSQLQVRIMTTNAVGNDEWVGVDNIVISSSVSAPSLSIGDAAVFEGDSGTTPISFTVTRAGDTSSAVTADYNVTFGSGPFDADSSDFAPAQSFTGTVSFLSGETSATITLDVQGDPDAEGDDGFTVTLSNPSTGTIADGTAIGTIVNDDGAPSLITVNDVTVTEGNSGTSLMTFTVTRTGGTDAFSVDYATADGSATTADGDYQATSGTLSFGVGETSQTVSVTINGDTSAELSETLQLLLSSPTAGALVSDGTGIGTIAGDDPLFIHQIQGTSYFSPILAAEGIHAFNTASAGTVIIQAVVTAVDADGPRQGFWVTEEFADWDGNNFTSEGIFVMTRNDAGVGTAVSGVAVGDLVTVSAHVMEYQGFAANMPITALTSPNAITVNGNALTPPAMVLDSSHPIPNEILTGVTPDYFDSQDDAGDSFDGANYGLSFWESVEGMLVTVPNMVVADGFISTSGGRPIFQAYSLDHANADQINSRGGYTVAGDPPVGPPDTPETGDDTHNGGRVLHDGDVNPDVIEVDFSGWSPATVPTGLAQNASMGDHIGDVTGIVEFDFTDRKLFVTDIDVNDFVNGVPTREVTSLTGDSHELTVATFNVENLDPGDGAARFTALANAIANNLHSPDIISIEEMQDNNGAAAGDDSSPTGTDASTTWQMLVDALNSATGAHYQWVDEAPVYNAEGGEQSGNIRVGFLYNTDRVQLGDLAANATLAERRAYTDRIGDGVRDAGDLIAFSDNMLGGEINTNDWTGTRRSLLGEFTFNGNVVYVAANHFPAKGGSGFFWQFDQTVENGSPNNSGWAQRNAVAQDLYSMMNLIEGSAPDAGIVSGGDYNDFYFYRPLTTATGYTMADGTARVGGSRFENLTLTLAEAERYTYAFDGRNQAIDHIIVNSLLGDVASYDVVHINTGYNPSGTGIDAIAALSDHDPALASFDFRNFAETLTGTAGADSLSGFGGNDTINGLGGADLLDGGDGDDIMSGGPGDDRYFVDQAGDMALESSGEGYDRVLASVDYVLAAGSEIEKLTTSDNFATTPIDLTGNELGQYLFGNAGANSLDGAGGADVMVGLGGDDRYYIDMALDRVIEAAGEGYDRVLAAVSWTLQAGSQVEKITTIDNLATTAINLTGNNLSQYIFGNAGANILDGGGGGDVLVGLGGDDRYIIRDSADRVIEEAAGGNDRVLAGASFVLQPGSAVETLSTIDNLATTAIDLAGNEMGQYLFGNAGANVLDGKLGNDILIGFGGADTFAFTTLPGASNVDRIVDFASGEDKIALRAFIYNALPVGALNADSFHVGSAAHDADDRIIYDSATGDLYYDQDGIGGHAPVLFARLDGHPSLSASDFAVI